MELPASLRIQPEIKCVQRSSDLQDLLLSAAFSINQSMHLALYETL